MICPYNRKQESNVLQWLQSDRGDGLSDCQQVETATFVMMDCPKDACAVWYDGKRHYHE